MRPIGKTLVAMSGGVDSSVAAALLVEQGFDVVGVTLHLWDAEGENKVGRCCAPEDREDARRTCDHLGIPHYVLDERDAFRREVVTPFLDEYRRGRTPTPCVHCNRTVKLEMLGALADQLGCSHVATGHYAKITHGPDGSRLFRGRDLHKDQSYFLFGLSPETRARLLFPLADLLKEETRREGERLGVPNARKPDSQELCFVPDGDVASFTRRELGEGAGGVVVDESGEILGRHDEIAGFTVGKRRGLSLGGGAPPRYVLRIVPDTHTVVVGGAEGLESRTLEARDCHLLREIPPEGIDAAVRIRYRHRPAPARVTPSDHGFEVEFAEPQRAITPGQAAVIYMGDEVLGGGFIA
jgi:tRNA-uridine 2-sulfurtransferase